MKNNSEKRYRHYLLLRKREADLWKSIYTSSDQHALWRLSEKDDFVIVIDWPIKGDGMIAMVNIMMELLDSQIEHKTQAEVYRESSWSELNELINGEEWLITSLKRKAEKQKKTEEAASTLAREAQERAFAQEEGAYKSRNLWTWAWIRHKHKIKGVIGIIAILALSSPGLIFIALLLGIKWQFLGITAMGLICWGAISDHEEDELRVRKIRERIKCG